MKIYLVSRGEYSDYNIEAAFSSREAAENYASYLNSELYNRGNYYKDFNDGQESLWYFSSGAMAGVEELEVDSNSPCGYQNRFIYYKIKMHRNGNILDIKTSGEKIHPHVPPSYRMSLVYAPLDVAVEVYCTAKSEEQAIKITNDIRRQLIAENLIDAYLYKVSKN